jgi:hypothetical protein
MAHAIEVAGVEEGDAGIERGVDRRDALLPVGRAVHARHAHAAEADCRDIRAGLPEFTRFHVSPPFSVPVMRMTRVLSAIA